MIYFDPILEKHLSKYLYIFKPEDIHFGLEYVDLSHPKAVWVLPKGSTNCSTVEEMGEELITVEFDENNNLLRESLQKILDLKSVELGDNVLNFEDIVDRQRDTIEQIVPQFDNPMTITKNLYDGYINLDNVTVFARNGIPSVDLSKFVIEQINNNDNKYCVIDLDIVPTFMAKYSGETIDEVGSMANAKSWDDITPITLADNVVYLFGTTETSKMEGLLQENWDNLLSVVVSNSSLSDYHFIVIMSLENMFTSIYKSFTRSNKGYVISGSMNYLREIAMKTRGMWANTTVLVDFPASRLDSYHKNLGFKLQSLKEKGKYINVL